MTRLLDSLKALGGFRLAGIAAVCLLVLGIVGGIVMRGNSQPMAFLFRDLDLRDSGQVVAGLDKLHVPYELRAGGAQILVPADQVDRLRLSMARDGVPAGGSVGYEVFDRGDSLTSNQFQQQMNQLRALEGELGRTIRTIRNVRAARVHLVLPKREPFAREQQEAQASIILSMAGGRRMDDGEVQAVVNLVSGAVPGLKAQNVTVVDDRGQSLTRASRGVGRDGALAAAGDEARRLIEQRLGQAVEDMLGRTVGAGHVRAEATVEMSFERSSETHEHFDPEDQVVRTQQSTTDASKNTEPQQSVSVQNNLPNPEAQAAGAVGASTNRQEENTTYEIGKTVRTVVKDAPSVRRVSMAVLIDGVTSRGPDGKLVWREMPQADLDRLAVLVKSAIGFDERRGDRVDVVSMRFSSPDEAFDADAPLGNWLQLGKADFIWLATLGTVALVALFALGFVVRPLALRLVAGLPGPVRVLPGSSSQAVVPLSAQGALSTEAQLQLADAADKDTMLNMANIHGEVRAASIQQLSEIVEAQPDASVSVIRGWLSQKAA